MALITSDCAPLQEKLELNGMRPGHLRRRYFNVTNLNPVPVNVFAFTSHPCRCEDALQQQKNPLPPPCVSFHRLKHGAFLPSAAAGRTACRAVCASRWSASAGAPRLTAAQPRWTNPCCSCKLTRVRFSRGRPVERVLISGLVAADRINARNLNVDSVSTTARKVTALRAQPTALNHRPEPHIKRTLVRAHVHTFRHTQHQVCTHTCTHTQTCTQAHTRSAEH